jgi:hypothetical protein
MLRTTLVYSPRGEILYPTHTSMIQSESAVEVIRYRFFQ